jgi:hypothetical protein
VTIHYVSAPSGSGKTFRLVERACKCARKGRRVLFLLPTIELTSKIIEQELLSRPDPPRHRAFHGGTVPTGSVAAALSDFSKSDIDGQVIFITHQVLPHIGFLADRYDWDVLIDEELQSHQCHLYKIPDTHHLITDHIELRQHNAIYSRIAVKDMPAMRKVATNENGDELVEQLRGVAQLLTNRHWESFVNTQMYNDLKEGRRGTLTVHSVLMPSVLAGFNSVLMASANFTDTMIFQLWERAGVEFREDLDLAQSLRFREHENGGLVTFKWADQSNWSKKRRLTRLPNPDPTDAHPHTVQGAIVSAAMGTFGDSPFLWQANKDMPDGVFGGKETRLPNLPHGLNDFSHINNIVFLSSLNPPPEHFRFLKTLKIGGYAVRRATYCSTAYQAIMRTSIRDPSNTDPKTAVVPDQSLAGYLTEVFPGSKSERLDTAIPPDEGPAKRPGRPRKHNSGRERVAVCRERKERQDLIDGILRLENPYTTGQEMLLVGSSDSCNGKGIEGLYTDFVTQFASATVYRGKKAADPWFYLTIGDVDLFVELLEHWHSRELNGKDSNFLISSAIFDPNHPEREEGKKRGIGNILYNQHIYLDFEKGEMKPETLADLFPYTRMVIFNSYNHEPNLPRFHVFIALTRRLTPKAHRFIWDQIKAKIEDVGYWVREPKPKMIPSGLDHLTRSPACLVFAPCQAKNPRDSFFWDYNGGQRALLDPLIWIENGVVAPHSITFETQPLTSDSQPFNNPRNVNRARVEAAIARWHELYHHKGSGNDGFFRLGVELRASGMNETEYGQILNEQVPFARTPKERKNQLPSIISSLRKTRQSSIRA